MSLLTAIRHRIEYGAARLFLALVDRLPARAAPAFAAVLGNLAYAFAAGRRRTALENIRLAGVAATPAEVRRIARASFVHFALLTIESLQAARLLTPATHDNHIAFDAPPATRDLLGDPARGFLAASGHLGNWEVMARAISFDKPVVAVAQPAKNPLVDRLMARRSADARYRTIPKREAGGTRLLRPLREGAILAIMIDQYALKKPVLVDFFGRPACSHRSIAALHLATRRPIVFFACRRIGPMRFAVTLSEPLVFEPTGDKNRDLHAILKNLNERLERAIREAPEQYLWSHRRWRPPKPWETPIVPGGPPSA